MTNSCTSTDGSDPSALCLRWQILLIILAALLSSCAGRRTGTAFDQASAEIPLSSFTDSLLGTPGVKKGFGSFTVAIQGERHSGDFEVVRNGTATHLSLYTSFGGLIGSVDHADDSGMVTFRGHTVHLADTQTLDTAGLTFGSLLTLADLIKCFCGKIPLRNEMAAHLTTSKIVFSHGEKIIAFESPGQNIYLHFSTRSNQIKRIQMDRFSSNDSLKLAMYRFRYNVPQQITLKADVKNYFNLKFERFVTP